MHKFPVKFGNYKLPTSTCVFNVGTATRCPSARLGLCPVHQAGKVCYALKPETNKRTRRVVLPYRTRQEKLFRYASPDRISKGLIEAMQRRRSKTRYLRWNESGDFTSQTALEKAYSIALAVFKSTGVKSYAYTARSDLDFSKRPACMVINGSGFMIDNAFVASDHPQGIVCKGNCRICSVCTKASGVEIQVKYH